MVRLPPERRSLSVLPYIINQYEDPDEKDNEYEHDEDDQYNEYENGDYEVVQGEEIGGPGKIIHQLIQIKGEALHFFSY